MEKYHINSRGEASICSATVGQCPYGPADEHFSNFASAQLIADFKHEAEHDVNTALNKYPMDNLNNEELRAYRRIVLNNLNDRTERTVESLKEPTSALSEEQIEKLKKEAEEEIMLEGFANKVMDWNEAKKKFNFKPWKNNVPKGLIEGFNNRKISKIFSENYFVNSNNELSIDDEIELRKREELVKESRYFKNFKSAADHYVNIAKNNIRLYKLTKLSEEDLEKELAEKTQKRLSMKMQVAEPVVKERKVNLARQKESNSSRKEILAKINREMSIRNNLTKYTDSNIINRVDSSNLSEGEYELNIKPYSKDGQIENIYLMANDNKLYKVISMNAGVISVKDSSNLEKRLSTKDEGYKKANLRGNYTFIEIDTDKSNLTEWKGDKKLNYSK